MTSEHASGVVLFDGVCNLCNGFVQFLIKRDRKERLRFASLQSNYGERIREKHLAANEEMDSVLFYRQKHVLVRSDAALEILKTLGGGWKLVQVLYIFPRGFRDAVYDWVASNRYRWFGKREVCMMPTPALERRFIS